MGYLYQATIKLKSGAEVKLDTVARSWDEAVKILANRNMVSINRIPHVVMRPGDRK
jgi:hypothetical protein